MYITGDLRILLRYAVLGVDDDERNVAAAYSCQRTDDAVTLDGFFFNGTLAAYAGGIDDVIALSVADESRVDGL